MRNLSKSLGEALSTLFPERRDLIFKKKSSLGRELKIELVKESSLILRQLITQQKTFLE